MTDKELRTRLQIEHAELPSLDRTELDTVTTLSQTQTAVMHNGREVVAAYQNANKWLDTIKESLLMDHGAIFFSNYIHELAHTMPERFDRFGGILHRAGMKVPYPGTGEFLGDQMDMNSIFQYVFEILDAIHEALFNFIKCTQDTPYHSLGSSAEDLMVELDQEVVSLNMMLQTYSRCNGDIIKFDQWVACYLSNRDKLLD